MRSSSRVLRVAVVSAAGLVCAFLALTLGAPAPANAAGSAERSVAFGADLKRSSTKSSEQVMLDFEARIGRKLAFTRVFLRWNSPLGTYEPWLVARGTTPIISVFSKRTDNTAVPWSSIATAAPGSTRHNEIVGWARKIRSLNGPVYFVFNHEPEAAASNDLGSQADFIAAWRTMRRVFAEQGVTNARFMFVSTANGYKRAATTRQYVPAWYPGDSDVDAIGVDAYNEATCRYTTGRWESLAQRASGFLAFANQHPTKPLWFAEWGSVEDPAVAGRKATWIDQARSLFKTDPAWSRVVGVSYFKQTRPGTPCDWQVDTSTSSFASFKAMALDPFYAAAAP